MSHLNALSNPQRQQIRNAFALLDGESKDSLITKDDLQKMYSNLGIKQPSETEIQNMFTIDNVDYSQKGISFTQFSNILAKELSLIEDRSSILEALQVFSVKGDHKSFKDELQIDLEDLKDACCSVRMNDDNRLSRSSFDESVKGFVSETIDGKKVFLASKWMSAYID
ncbi:MLC2 [Candida margitis]|uniref:MLC2 n=1 Tax=Candida margitis TaxID=1775924 RepID=UPI0022266B5A|nr:MLC2 [Candida margitis]KAI5970264.1 MLC2 [Candida margitis]